MIFTGTERRNRGTTGPRQTAYVKEASNGEKKKEKTSSTPTTFPYTAGHFCFLITPTGEEDNDKKLSTQRKVKGQR